MKRTLALAVCLFGCVSSPESQSAGSEGPRNSDVDAVFGDLVGMRPGAAVGVVMDGEVVHRAGYGIADICLLYTSPSPRDATLSRMPSSA